jgi:hypothetical protein
MKPDALMSAASVLVAPGTLMVVIVPRLIVTSGDSTSREGAAARAATTSDKANPVTVTQAKIVLLADLIFSPLLHASACHTPRFSALGRLSVNGRDLISSDLSLIS